MGKKGGDGGGEAAQARADEQARQDKIRRGTARVNSIFDGGPTGDGKLDLGAAYDPTKTYFQADGTAWAPQSATRLAEGVISQMGVAGNASGSVVGTPEEQFRAALGGGGLYTGTKTASGFNDQFFDGRKQAFMDYATPQLEDQYADANKKLTYSLARSGLLDSSVRAEKGAELQKQYDLNKQQVADQALSYSTEARNNVEKARGDLITMLNATGDAEGAASSAMARSQALSAPQAYSPLTQLFADFTSGLATQAGYERSQAAGGTGGRYNTGLFSNTKSVVNNK